MISKANAKRKAQDHLMIGLSREINYFSERQSIEYMTVEEVKEADQVLAEMKNQFKRVEKLFGYDADSWRI